MFFPFLMSLAFSVQMLLVCLVCFLLLSVSLMPLVFMFIKYRLRKSKERSKTDKVIVGIFHPYCNSGGGGERVLWTAVNAMQRRYPNAEFHIYTGDIEYTPQEILSKAKKVFNVSADGKIKFVYLRKRKWIEPRTYPYFTLLGQALGSMFLGYEGLSKLQPDIYIETTGFTFTLPIFKYLGGCQIGCYVHYPTITSDMLRRVSRRQAMYNNQGFIARSPFFTNAKLLYYHIFSWMYSLAGNCSDIIMVNSTFTMEHLTNLWNRPLHLVYPPCEINHLKSIPRPSTRPPKIRIVSLAQFRPEKDHPLQLQALYELREIVPEHVFDNVTLVICGSCRNADDADLVKDVQDLSKHLSLEKNVEFRINLTYEDIIDEFTNGFIGIHTMLDEHFGISVVEMMAAGLVVVAHRSGGPLLDIIETSEGSRLGYLAVSAEEFAAILKYLIVRATDEEIEELRVKARASVDRFSSEKFVIDFLRAVDPLFK